MKKYPILALSLLLATASVYGDPSTNDTAEIQLISAGGYASPGKKNQPNQTKTPAADTRSQQVYLSSPAHCFEIQFTPMLLQPTGSNLGYAAEAQPLPVPSPDWKIHNIETDYHFGFDIGMEGILHNTNTNIMMNWERFHSSDSASQHVALASNMIGPFFEIGPDAGTYTKAKGNVKFHFDEVSLDYGIFVNLGSRLKTNWFGGVSFARIKQTLFSQFTSNSGSTLRSIKVPSTFQGFGPQLGMNFCYQIVKGFEFTGGVTGSLFVGKQRNHTSYVAKSPALPVGGVTSPNKQQTRVAHKTQIVPGIEGKLGLAYVFTFCDHYMVKLAAGYEAQVYIDAIQSIDMGSEVVTPPVIPDTVGVFARTFARTISNFSLAGPYFVLGLGF